MSKLVLLPAFKKRIDSYLSYENKFYEEFQPWLQEKLGVKSVTSWAKLIMLSCHNEKIGFESFYRLLAEFKQDIGLAETETALKVKV